MQLAEGIPGWNLECAFDDRVGGTNEGEVECISIPFRRKKKKGEKKKGSVKAPERIVVQHEYTPPAIFLMKFPILSNQHKHKNSAIDPIFQDSEKNSPSSDIPHHNISFEVPRLYSQNTEVCLDSGTSSQSNVPRLKLVAFKIVLDKGPKRR